MAKIRPVGRTKSDHRVCQVERFARAAKYRSRIHITVEKQEAVFASVNKPCSAGAARRRKRKYIKRVSDDGASLRDGCSSSKEKRSVVGKTARQKPDKSLEHIAKKAIGEFPTAPMLSIILCCLKTGERQHVRLQVCDKNIANYAASAPRARQDCLSKLRVRQPQLSAFAWLSVHRRRARTDIESCCCRRAQPFLPDVRQASNLWTTWQQGLWARAVLLQCSRPSAWLLQN
jgi:hypothetical protein